MTDPRFELFTADDGHPGIRMLTPDEVERKCSEALDELAALNARRCDGCAWFAEHIDDPDSAFGSCLLALRRGDDPVRVYASVGDAELWVEPDHYCAAWAPKETD